LFVIDWTLRFTSCVCHGSCALCFKFTAYGATEFCVWWPLQTEGSREHPCLYKRKKAGNVRVSVIRKRARNTCALGVRKRLGVSSREHSCHCGFGTDLISMVSCFGPIYTLGPASEWWPCVVAFGIFA